MKRILVIEDDPAVRDVIVEALQTRKWEPIEAGDGEEGLKAALLELPDLILCDIRMPKLDGYEVLRGVRASGTTATIPFLFLTGHGDKPMMRQAMEMGADDFITKPFTIPELLAAIDARLEKQSKLEQTADKRLAALRDSLRSALPHELVTPLNTILGFAGLLLESTPARAEEVQEYAAHIKNSGERLRGLIEKFLVYTQVELLIADGSQRAAYLDAPPGPARGTIMTVAARVASEQKRTGDLSMEVEELEHPIAESHLERIVRELLENAFKFSPPGTEVQVIGRERNGGLELEIIDHGRGFSAEQIRQVSANVQFDRKISEQQGSGLGLAICLRLAELYGGRLEIKSKPEEETRLRLELPK